MLHTVSSIAERQAGKLLIPTLMVFGLTQLGIELASIVLVADCHLSTAHGGSFALSHFSAGRQAESCEEHIFKSLV